MRHERLPSRPRVTTGLLMRSMVSGRECVNRAQLAVPYRVSGRVQGGSRSVTSRVVLAAGLLAAALTLTDPVGARAAISLRLLGRSITPLYTDGDRWAALEPSVGTTEIIDSSTGQSATRSDPVGCEGGLRGIGSGELFYMCIPEGCPPNYVNAGIITCPAEQDATIGYRHARYVVVDIYTGQQQPVAGADRLPYRGELFVTDDSAEPQLEAIGTEWAQGYSAGETPRCYLAACQLGDLFYVNWHSGELVESDGNLAREVVDLDAASRFRPLCSPLRRIAYREPYAHEAGRAFLPIDYAPPFAVTAGRLFRCGRKHGESLPGDQDGAQIGGGIASWGIGYPSVLMATRLTVTGREWHAAIDAFAGPPQHGDVNQPILFQHTSRAVYESVIDELDRIQIYTADMP